MAELINAGHTIHFETQLQPLLHFLEDANYSKIFIFTDRNTCEQCLPVLQAMLGDYTNFDLIETDPGEENKNIDFCIGIWKTLLDFEADRKCLMINLGGGVITDMGGFVASTYKRGIDFINIPTTLLAQVDASVGGKTGIDIDNIKNMIGTFALPQAVFIESEFLKTLPERELLSGFAEMIKHGLILDAAYYEALKAADYRNLNPELVYQSVAFKNQVVTEDPLEKGLRKILNFGHTIGHAVESHSLSNSKMPLTHGEAIAIGMICEAYLSTKNSTLSLEELHDISSFFVSIYPRHSLQAKQFPAIMELMKSDKKNEHGQINFSLLEGIGKCEFNCRVAEKDVADSLAYYQSLYKDQLGN
jgi:3-dehydroquinate synthase